MVLLINSRGGVISVPEPRAKKLLATGKFQKAPEGAVKGQYLAEFDELAPKPEPKPEPKKKVAAKKSTKKTTKKAKSSTSKKK